MSNVICTSAMCQQGKASVDTMERTFNVLLGNPLFNRAHFEPTVTSLEQSFQDQWHFYTPYIPFNPACCAIQDIGQQADDLTNAMLASVGAESTGTGPSQQKPPINFDTATTLITLGIVAVLVSNVAPFIRKR